MHSQVGCPKTAFQTSWGPECEHPQNHSADGLILLKCIGHNKHCVRENATAIARWPPRIRSLGEKRAQMPGAPLAYNTPKRAPPCVAA